MSWAYFWAEAGIPQTWCWKEQPHEREHLEKTKKPRYHDFKLNVQTHLHKEINWRMNLEGSLQLCTRKLSLKVVPDIDWLWRCRLGIGTALQIEMVELEKEIGKQYRQYCTGKVTLVNQTKVWFYLQEKEVNFTGKHWLFFLVVCLNKWNPNPVTKNNKWIKSMSLIKTVRIQPKLKFSYKQNEGLKFCSQENCKEILFCEEFTNGSCRTVNLSLCTSHNRMPLESKPDLNSCYHTAFGKLFVLFIPVEHLGTSGTILSCQSALIKDPLN
jgi:hypothetical protein